MELSIVGRVRKVSGPVVECYRMQAAKMFELVEVGNERLIGEVVHLEEDRAVIQVYEDTTSLRPDAVVYGSGMPLSVELGPGLVGAIYDGVQRPLDLIREKEGEYVKRGVHFPALVRRKKWHFIPEVSCGKRVKGGEILGRVPETELVEHRILVPPQVEGEVVKIVSEGDYTLDDTIAVLKEENREIPLFMFQRWPVRTRRPYRQRLALKYPLITGQRVIDILFPVAKGGCVAVPGGFGTGKTMIQHQLAKWSDADIVVFIGCGERGNEMTDVLMSFPKLIDPRSGRPLTERTVFIANTSNMPVAAREASIYTGITIAEYFRDMGYNVAVMADSTSRWAEALRELSGRMEEMPADEGFPAYLPTRLAEFYERAGMVKTLSEREASVTIIGSVSPPGGDFSEPVTQHTKRFIRTFWALDRDLANARHYPSISWMESYSEYIADIAPWYAENISKEWLDCRNSIMELMQKEARLQSVVKLVGPDVLPDTQKLILETALLFKTAFLQQNAFDKIDTYAPALKQFKMLKIIVEFYRRGLEAIRAGVPLVFLKKIAAYRKITRMKFSVANEELEKLDEIYEEMKEEIKELAE